MRAATVIGLILVSVWGALAWYQRRVRVDEARKTLEHYRKHIQP